MMHEKFCNSRNYYHIALSDENVVIVILLSPSHYHGSSKVNKFELSALF